MDNEDILYVSHENSLVHESSPNDSEEGDGSNQNPAEVDEKATMEPSNNNSIDSATVLDVESVDDSRQKLEEPIETERDPFEDIQNKMMGYPEPDVNIANMNPPLPPNDKKTDGM